MPHTSENVLSKPYLRTYALFVHSQTYIVTLQIDYDKISAAEINDILKYFMKRDSMMDLYR